MHNSESMNSKNKDLILKYFEAWNNRDLQALAEMSSSDIELEDWEISVAGKRDFLRANEKIFEKNPKISVKILNLFENAYEVVAILEIKLEKFSDGLFIIDHFTIKNSKIIKINAYRSF